MLRFESHKTMSTISGLYITLGRKLSSCHSFLFIVIYINIYKKCLLNRSEFEEMRCNTVVVVHVN